MAEASGGSEAAKTSTAKCPVSIIVLGMAGSGKTTFVQRLTAHLHAKKQPPYVVNLDPAVHEVPYPANIDIRDTVKYKEVMKQFSLGPNGGIITSLNLFATRFDQVMNFMEKKGSEYQYAVFDTPGQIEVFTWSASGSIITEALASTFPTVVVYIMDTARSTNPVTFMSNMLYACSILYKSRLPFIVVMNKTDIVDHSFAIEWMQDFEVFQEALAQDTTYMSSLTRSMSLVLDEFYQNLQTIGVSSMTGAGFDEFMQAVGKAVLEYENDYKPEYERLKAEKAKKSEEDKKQQIDRLTKDLGQGKDVPMTPPLLTSEHRPHGITLGAGLDSDDDDDDDNTGDDADEDCTEGQSFQRYIKQFKTEGSEDAKTEG